ncbi:Pre-mRNA-splicing factor prp46 [Diplonema papillatum]|nr:Pre-mRNA-splicing factor prp46 [Diplonema papillatum]WGM49984.1 PRL1 [Diplonema papillatum]
MSQVQAKRRRDEASELSTTEEVPEILKKRTQQAKTLFVHALCGKPTEPADTVALRTTLKLRRVYGTTPDGAKSRVAEAAAKKETQLLIKGPEGAVQQTSSVGKALPEPTGAGQLVVHGSKDEAKKQQEKAAKKAVSVLPMTGAELRALHDKAAPKPQWHAPWKLHRVIAGHVGWVHTVAVDHSNEWFISAGADRTIKVWDLATGVLKTTFTGHISAIRAVAISSRSPYMFSCAEDGMVLCWDLEQNKIIRKYHGHLNGVYSMALHPKLDILATGGRDASVRVWDIRTKAEIHCLTGHRNPVGSLVTPGDTTFISGSQDTQIRVWDFALGRCVSTLTHHKKGVRALAVHPKEYTFASGAADNIKKWKCPRGEFLMNFSGHNAIVNAVAINHDNVLVSGGLDGGLRFWDWKTGYNFQKLQTIPQPGSLEAEQAIHCATFDHSGSRLLTGEADKTIKVWKEDETATPETHPVEEWKPPRRHY